MAGDLPVDTAHLLGLAVSMLMYGWYISMFLRVIEGLWARRRRSRVVVWVTIGLFLVTTLNLMLCAVDEYNAWIKHRTDPGVVAYFSLTNFMTIRPVIYGLMTTAMTSADILVIWRLYAIWNKSNLIIILPAVLLVSDFAIGATVSITAIVIGSNFGGAHHKALTIANTMSSTNGVLLNVSSTALAVIVSLVESGALFTVTLVLFTVFNSTEYLNDKFPSPPNDNGDSAVDVEAPITTPVPFGFGEGFRRHVTENVPQPAARLTLSPIENFQSKNFRSSPEADSPSGSSASARGSRKQRNLQVSGPSLSSSSPGTELRPRLEDDGGVGNINIGHVDEEEGVTPLPSPKFATRLDYFSKGANVEVLDTQWISSMGRQDDPRDRLYG
ncbi:hypothetical protein FRB98_003107 [Tulasnella sp. 332]|nr:hypothetical protein FRB98_003107 [Tulasnella sp. 332]